MNITPWLEDMNFMFSWQEQHLTSERSDFECIGDEGWAPTMLARVDVLGNHKRVNKGNKNGSFLEILCKFGEEFKSVCESEPQFKVFTCNF